MKIAQQLPISRHFRLEPMADGVYAAIHIRGGAAIGNAGIIDLGDRTLVYDTFFTPQAGKDLRMAAEALTGRPVDAAINSHYHNDHIWGNQVFDAETDIISSAKTRDLVLATRGHDDYDTFVENAEVNLESTLRNFRATPRDAERRQLALWIDYHQALVEAKPRLQVRAPNVTFHGRMAFHGPDRSAALISFSEGHSPCDAVLHLPQDGIIFMSDLLFIDHHPWIGSGDPDRLVRILSEILGFGLEQVVPGHGPVGTPDSLAEMQAYIRTLDGLARSMVAQRVPEEEIDAMAIPEPYGRWLFAAFFPLNLHFLYQRRADELARLRA